MDRDRSASQEARLLRLLEDVLALEVNDVQTAMDRAAQRVADVLAADKVDVFLHDPNAEVLVAIGTSRTPMGGREQELGLDRLPIADGGRTVETFQSGRSYLTRRADREHGEAKGIVEDLGVRSAINVAIEVAGVRRGVLLASSATPEFFSERDVRVVEAVAHWLGLVGYRLAYTEQVVARAAEESLRLAAETVVGALSPRQQEVAGLIAGGLSNAEIAERLVLTSGTVANHVRAILLRLGFRSRTQVGVWAADHGLLPTDGDPAPRPV